MITVFVMLELKNIFKVSHTVSVSCLAVSIDRQDGARDMPGGGDWNKKLKYYLQMNVLSTSHSIPKLFPDRMTLYMGQLIIFLNNQPREKKSLQIQSVTH